MDNTVSKFTQAKVIFWFALRWYGTSKYSGAGKLKFNVMEDSKITMFCVSVA